MRTADDGCSTPLAKASTSRDDNDATRESEMGRLGDMAETHGYDLMRTARFGLTGLTLHGPFFNK